MIRYLALSLLLVACSTPELILNAPPYRLRGQEVRYEHNIGLEGHMAAQWRAGSPIIYFHPARVVELSDVMLYFTLFHEHCHLEHVDGSEIRADCCGLAKLYGMGLGGDSVLAEVTATVSAWPGSEDHPPGTYRALALLACSIAID